MKTIRNRNVTIRVAASRYQDADDCLDAAELQARVDRDLDGWNLSPRWEDDEQRDYILLDIPAFAATAAEIEALL